MDGPGVEAHDLRKAYRRVRAVDGISLSVPRGGVVALLGPNGAGKTTTVRMLATLTRPDAGRALVGGLDVVRSRREVRRRIGVTGQFAALDPVLTVNENLWTTARLRGLAPRDARRERAVALERLGLGEVADRRAEACSGGTRRRLDLAMGLLGGPATVFLDEPTTGLDPASRRDVWALVGGLAAAGTTIVLTTQYLDEADRLADRICLIDGGRVVAEGTPAALKRRVAENVLDVTPVDAGAARRLRERWAGLGGVAGAPVGAGLGSTGAGSAGAETGLLGLPTDGTAAHVRDLLDRLDPDRSDIAHFVVRGADLDDVFLALTGARAEGESGPGPAAPSAGASRPSPTTLTTTEPADA